MDFLKVLFENGALTWEQFTAAVKDKGFKLADLATGNYVDKSKYDTLETSNSALTKDLKERNTDIAKLKKQLEDAGADGDKLQKALDDMAALQTKYDDAEKTHKAELAKAKYEYAVKEFANGQPFNSAAARRDFERSMIDKGLKMDGDTILGASDFLDTYKTENADSFTSDGGDGKKAPKFTEKTGGGEGGKSENPFLSNMTFAGVRPKTE